jgi:enoyl-CoA hydratase/carnithine racemase
MSAVGVRRDGPLAVVVLDKPPLNLFDREVFDGFRAALDDLEADLPRAVLVRAEGRVVSAGVDVHEFEGLDPDAAEALARELIALTHRLEALPLPTVFAAHGLCLTAAFELSLGCDLLLATPRAAFGLVEKVVGITPFMGGAQRVAERAGPARARELVMTAETFPAEVLERWGVVNRVLDADGFEEAAVAFARSLAEGPTQAHAATKAVVRAQVHEGTPAADELVVRRTRDLFATEDARSAVRSFLDEGPGKATYVGR